MSTYANKSMWRSENVSGLGEHVKKYLLCFLGILLLQWKIRYKTLIYCGIAEIPHPIENRGRGTRWWRQILNRKWKYGRFAHAQYKIRYIILIYGGMSEILASFRKSGPRHTMVASDFRPEIEMWPIRVCAVKIRYKTLIYGGIAEFFPSYRKSGVEEHDGDVRF